MTLPLVPNVGNASVLRGTYDAGQLLILIEDGDMFFAFVLAAEETLSQVPPTDLYIQRLHDYDNFYFVNAGLIDICARS